MRSQTSIQRLETPLGWASADPFAFVMLMSTFRCTARHSGACRCAPIDFACPRGSRFQPKQGSDSSRRARDTAATMLHFTHFWRHRGESAMKHCQLYNCTCKKCVYIIIWIYKTRIDPTMLNFVAIFIDMPPALPEARKLLYPCSTKLKGGYTGMRLSVCPSVPTIPVNALPGAILLRSRPDLVGTHLGARSRTSLFVGDAAR